MLLSVDELDHVSCLQLQCWTSLHSSHIMFSRLSGQRPRKEAEWGWQEKFAKKFISSSSIQDKQGRVFFTAFSWQLKVTLLQVNLRQLLAKNMEIIVHTRSKDERQKLLSDVDVFIHQHRYCIPFIRWFQIPFYALLLLHHEHRSKPYKSVVLVQLSPNKIFCL